MDFETFVEKVKFEVQRICPDKKVVVQAVFKNNDTKLTGMTLLDEGKRLSPTLYLERYYDEFFSVGVDIETIANHIFAEWEKHSNKITSDAMTYAWIKKVGDHDRLAKKIFPHWYFPTCSSNRYVLRGYDIDYSTRSMSIEYNYIMVLAILRKLSDLTKLRRHKDFLKNSSIKMIIIFNTSWKFLFH